MADVPAYATAAARDPVGALAMKLRVRDALSDEEVQVLRDAVTEERDVPAGRVIIRAGAALEESTLLSEGFIGRYKDLANGERQIQEVHVHGDFVDLHGFVLKRLDHNVAALSRCRLAIVPHSKLREITESHAHLARMLWFSTMLDASIQRETIVSVGRRTALARIAHLMCELCLRLEIVGAGDRSGFELPITQQDLADATGLTSVHVNRMLRQLRDHHILTFRHGEVAIHDWETLVDRAEFDPAYLHVERISR